MKTSKSAVPKNSQHSQSSLFQTLRKHVLLLNGMEGLGMYFAFALVVIALLYFASAAAVVLCTGMLPVLLLQSERRYNWIQHAAIANQTPKEYLVEKYRLGYLLIGIAVVFALLYESSREARLVLFENLPFIQTISMPFVTTLQWILLHTIGAVLLLHVGMATAVVFNDKEGATMLWFAGYFILLLSLISGIDQSAILGVKTGQLWLSIVGFAVLTAVIAYALKRFSLKEFAARDVKRR